MTVKVYMFDQNGRQMWYFWRAKSFSYDLKNGDRNSIRVTEGTVNIYIHMIEIQKEGIKELIPIGNIDGKMTLELGDMYPLKEDKEKESHAFT